MNISFIGTGVMGTPIIRHLAKLGHKISVYNRTYEKAIKLKDVASVFDTLKAVVFDADLVFTMLGLPSDVAAIYEQMKDFLKAGTTVIDMTTSSPRLARSIYAAFKEKGISVLDAPVTGGEIGAINGTLTMMVGGDFEVFAKHEKILSAFTKKIYYMGSAGKGQEAKLVNQVAIAGSIAGLCESLAVAMKQGLNLEHMLDVLKNGSASSWQAINNGAHILNHMFDPGFYIKHFVKDLRLAVDEMPMALPIAQKVLAMYESLDQETFNEQGIQALIKYYL